MTAPKIRRIDCAAGDAARELAALRSQLNSHADVISEKGKKLTLQVFGEPLSPRRVVERVCQDVRENGADALFDYTEKFDQVRLDADSLLVRREEMLQARRETDPQFIDAIRRIRHNLLSFQIGLIHSDAILRADDRFELRMRYRPVRRIGVCIPGGAAAYPSTLLMTVCPAQAAGVKEIAVVMPPTQTGAFNTDLLATCHELGVTEVYRVGGAQAVAALAYGVDGLRPVDMIVGPGNIFVTLAKKYVFGQTAIDCLAGPSEVIVVADESANAKFIASDLIAQAEHDPGSSLLISWHRPLIDAVHEELGVQLQNLPRAEQARNSLEKFGALVCARDCNQAVQLVNQLAPEHLHVQTKDAANFADKIDNAGAIFVGAYSPVALGDYAAGPSHVLPTGGTARFASGLSATDFLRRSSVLAFTSAGMEELASSVRLLAQKEGLTGHAASVDVRMNNSLSRSQSE